MKDLEQARALLDAAGRDLSALRLTANVADFPDEIFGFHVRQAAEKSLKVWLSPLCETYPPTHDLAWLLKKLEALDVEAARFGTLVEYNSYAVQFRYATTPDVGPLDRAAALRLLEELMERVRTMLEYVKKRKTIDEEIAFSGLENGNFDTRLQGLAYGNPVE